MKIKKRMLTVNDTYHEAFTHVVRLRYPIIPFAVFSEAQEDGIDGHLQKYDSYIFRYPNMYYNDFTFFYY